MCLNKRKGIVAGGEVREIDNIRVMKALHRKHQNLNVILNAIEL